MVQDVADVCRTWRTFARCGTGRGTRCQDVQQNQPTVEKLEKNFKKSSERKKERESKEERTRKSGFSIRAERV